MDIKLLYDKFRECSGVTTDSRAIRGGEMFFALRGENFDGNAYASAAIEAGAAYAVVAVDSEVALNAADFPFASKLIPVPDPLGTLKALARYHRDYIAEKHKRLTVIGLTGTNGKTTTKELIKSVLSAGFKVTATEGNLNNDIGVPLSVLKISGETEFAVIEMGANHPEDIAGLVTVCNPDCGLITNVGKAHLAGFGSFDGVKKAKGRLYDYISAHGGFVFINADDIILREMAGQRPGLELIPYGIDYWGAIVLPSDASHPYLRMAVPDNLDPSCDNLSAIETHLVGDYNAANVAAAIAVGVHFGISLEAAADAVASFVPSNNRSQMVETSRNRVIVDAYNANPTSMAAAIANFRRIEDSRKVLMLGDMRELGEDSLGEHEAIVGSLLSADAEKVFLVGEEFGKALSGAGVAGNIEWFPDSVALAGRLKESPLEGCTILLKGSRGMTMEKVLPEL